MKAIKEKEQLQKTLDSWKDSSKNLWRLINSGMSSNSKVGLGFEIQSNNEVLSYEEEMNFSVFNVQKRIQLGKLCTGPQEPEPNVSDDRSSEYSTCQSNDSAGSIGTSSEHSIDPESKISSVPPISKMAREAEVKKQRVLNTGNMMAKLVWTNTDRINHTNQFVPRSVQLNTGRTNINYVRPNIITGRTNINSVRPRVNIVNSNVNTVRSRQPVPTQTSNSFSPKRPQMNQFNQRRHFSKSHSSVRRPFAKNTVQMSHSHVVKGNWGSAVKTSAGYNWRNTIPNSNCNGGPISIRTDHPLKNMVDRGIFDSGCSGHMTGNKDQLEDFEEFNGGSVTFGGSKGYITGKGKIRVGNLDFDSVSFVKELGHFNLFSISQICDKQHKVLFTETECLVVSSDFKMPDENQILLKVPRHHNMYSFDMKTPSLTKDYACLIAKATCDESKLWHRRLGHINFKNLNKLVKGNLVRGLPSKVFKNDHTCVACHKGKQHRASCKAKLERLITEPLHTLHMDLFGPTSVKSINHASYCLVITDDCTRFSWVFFLASKDETSGILQNFIRQIENQLSHRVKIIRSDNGTEFKNRDMLEFCGNKGIKQEYSNARTPQQNGVAERMNRTLIEAARTMLADSLLPTTFWAEAVSTACYIFNRVRVTKPQNKTPYELLFGHKPIISYIRPFGCHVTILDTLSVLGKFDGKSDEGFLVGYSLNSKAYRVYNLVTKRVEVNLHVNFLEDKPNVKGVGYRWMFDIDYLTDSMNYIPVSLENQANPHAGASEVTNSAGTSQTPVLRYTKRKSLARKGLQKKPESAKSGTEEDVEAYMEERVDEPSSEEFPMSSIPQGPAPAKIVKWQIIKTGKRSAYQIIREDNTDVYGNSKPEEEFERVLWGDLKTMFDPPSEEDAIWKLPHQQQILNWRYFHSCSVHCLTLEAAHIYMLTEVKYPLPPRVCKAMLEKKLLGDRKDECKNGSVSKGQWSWHHIGDERPWLTELKRVDEIGIDRFWYGLRERVGICWGTSLFRRWVLTASPDFGACVAGHVGDLQFRGMNGSVRHVVSGWVLKGLRPEEGTHACMDGGSRGEESGCGETREVIMIDMMYIVAHRIALKQLKTKAKTGDDGTTQSVELKRSE
ncbi:putative ribonuclease H-like domain-containing protein [Tanacetum coccineum]